MGMAGGAGTRPRASGDLSSLVSRDKLCSDTSRSHQCRRDTGGISEDKATSVAYGGQQGRRAGSHRHEMKRGGLQPRVGDRDNVLQGPQLPGQGVGCWEIACPPPLQPSKYLGGGCTSPLQTQSFAYPKPPKSICLSSGGGKPWGWKRSPHPLPQLESSIWACSVIPAF